jgi:hypothetical protein
MRVMRLMRIMECLGMGGRPVNERMWLTTPRRYPALRIFEVPEPRPTSILAGLLVTRNWGFGLGELNPVEVGDESLAELLDYIARVNKSRGR